MTAIVNGIMVTGTPSEIYELIQKSTLTVYSPLSTTDIPHQTMPNYVITATNYC